MHTYIHTTYTNIHAVNNRTHKPINNQLRTKIMIIMIMIENITCALVDVFRIPITLL